VGYSKLKMMCLGLTGLGLAGNLVAGASDLLLSLVDGRLGRVGSLSSVSRVSEEP
jgi:hypothetical protein